MTVQAWLRALPVFAAAEARPVPEPTDDPAVLFERWLLDAAGAGAVEPHAMTLSTVDAAGDPDARILILKDLTGGVWWFATSRDSAKGQQLRDRPAAALTFAWPAVGRSVRIRGDVVLGSPAQSAADFTARGDRARTVAALSRESRPLSSRDVLEAALRSDPADAATGAGGGASRIAGHWQVYGVRARHVEFWQADPGRAHHRLAYDLSDGRWSHGLLWP